MISGSGILPNKRNEPHSKVPITTIIITPMSTATGIISMYLSKYKIKKSKTTAATMPDSLPRPPDLILIKLCPTMAQPPIPPKKPVIVFASPWPIHSLLGRPVVSVKSSIKLSVNRLSIRPTSAITIAYGKTILSISKSKGTFGI